MSYQGQGKKAKAHPDGHLRPTCPFVSQYRRGGPESQFEAFDVAIKKANDPIAIPLPLLQKVFSRGQKGLTFSSLADIISEPL